MGRNRTDMHERRNGTDIRDQKWGTEKPTRSEGINSGKKACYICGSYKHLANQCEERGRSRWRDNNPRDDPELKKYWRLAEKPDETGRSWYCVEQAILYRRYRNEKT